MRPACGLQALGFGLSAMPRGIVLWMYISRSLPLEKCLEASQCARPGFSGRRSNEGKIPSYFLIHLLFGSLDHHIPAVPVRSSLPRSCRPHTLLSKMRHSEGVSWYHHHDRPQGGHTTLVECGPAGTFESTDRLGEQHHPFCRNTVLRLNFSEGHCFTE